MQAKLNIVLKLATELGLSIKTDSPLYAVSNLDDNDRLRLSLTELVDEYEISEGLLDELSGKLNDVKKKIFEIGILETGRRIGTPIELKDLKSRGIEKLVSIPKEVKNQVISLESYIHEEQSFLSEQRKKSKESIVEENNLLPNLNFRVGISLLLTLFASIFVVLGYIASTDERFYDKDFGYWSMLLGGLAVLVTLNLFIIRVVQAVRFNLNRKTAIDELATKYILKLEAEYEALESKVRGKMFNLESVVYLDACKEQLSISKKDQRELLIKVSTHMQ